MYHQFVYYQWSITTVKLSPVEPSDTAIPPSRLESPVVVKASFSVVALSTFRVPSMSTLPFALILPVIVIDTPVEPNPPPTSRLPTLKSPLKSPVTPL